MAPSGWGKVMLHNVTLHQSHKMLNVDFLWKPVKGLSSILWGVTEHSRNSMQGTSRDQRGTREKDEEDAIETHRKSFVPSQAL